MGIFSQGYDWPGEAIDPYEIDDPIDYDTGDCGVLGPDNEIWSFALGAAAPGLGEIFSEPSIQGDGSIAAWLYAWIYVSGASYRAYVTPTNGIELSTPTYSSFGGGAQMARGLQWKALYFPPSGNKKYTFSWGANPADISWSYEHDYSMSCADFYGCAEQNNEEVSLGFWYSPADADEIVRSWESGYVSDCFFVANVRVFADRFFFPAPWFLIPSNFIHWQGLLGALSSIIPGGAIAAIQQVSAGSNVQRLKKRGII